MLDYSVASIPLMYISMQIMEDIDYYEIPIYNFPYDVEEDDEETITDNIELRVCLFLQCYLLYLVFTLLLDKT